MKQKSLFLTISVLLGLRITTMAQTPPSYVPTDGLVGWWPFNGNANDESGMENDGLMVGGISNTEDRFGNSSAAFLFDGVSGYIDVPSLNNLPYTPISYSAWVIVNSYFPSSFGHKFRSIIGRNTAFVGDNGVIGFYADNNVNGGAYDNNFLMWRGASQAGIAPVTGVIPPLNEWIHIVYTQSVDGDWKWYQNGLLTNSGNFTDAQNDFNYFQIGSCNNYTVGEGPYWNDKLDDIGLWNRALTSEEIASLYYSAECTSDISITPVNAAGNLGATVSFSANTSDFTPIYSWQTDLGQGFQNIIDYGNYSGASTSTLTISELQLINHNQPIRVISTSGICIDTSAVAFISIADTCITQVMDTTYITVTDTLIINLGPTGFNPVTYSNTILMYPNPSNDQLTIDYGDYATLAGYTLKIFNSMGQEIHSANINQQQEVLPLGTWGGAGNYQVVIYNAQGVPVDTRTIVLQ
jgi:Concanavalin A-like lectin/glucanases superfamily/Secretion system C-terminal sorting domain